MNEMPFLLLSNKDNWSITRNCEKLVRSNECTGRRLLIRFKWRKFCTTYCEFPKFGLTRINWLIFRWFTTKRNLWTLFHSLLPPFLDRKWERKNRLHSNYSKHNYRLKTFDWKPEISKNWEIKFSGQWKLTKICYIKYYCGNNFSSKVKTRPVH